MKIEVIKKPIFEDDTFYFIAKDIKNINLPINDEYLNIKMEKFRNFDYSKDGFEKFKDRPSFKNFENLNKLDGTIYTWKCQTNNDMMTYNNIIENIKKHKDTSKRVYLNICDNFSTYIKSINENINVSCLSNIHYLKNNVNIIYRANDIKNELFYDFITIYKFFIQPIYKNNININYFASSAQNIEFFNQTIKLLKKL
jgi:hypothetical protein